MRKRPPTSRLLLGAALFGSMSTSCISGPEPTTDTHPTAVKMSSTDMMIASLPPAKLLPKTDLQKKVDVAIENHFQRNATRRAYVMTDKPLYQPGETIWFRTNLRAASTLTAANPTGMEVKLVSPRGAVVAQKRVMAQDGIGANDFELSADIEGGEYTLVVTADDGTTDQRKVIVNTYEAPRLKKDLQFVRKAYGPGDQVSAAIEMKRATGEVFANRALTGVVTVDDVEVTRVPIMTDAQGKAVAHFTLPAQIARGDGLLTILAEDGGVTESIQKRIPILMHTLQLSMFPEGGELVEGLPGRVYLSALNTMGKPADVEGRVLDDRGNVVADFRSVHDGMGRFDLTPEADRTYHVEITSPVGITGKFDVPAAKMGGCALRSMEDLSAKPNPDKIELAAICTTARTVLIEATLREKHIAGGSLEVPAGKPARIELPVDAADQGAVRVTLFDAKQEPLAERLVYHGRGQDLKVKITADKKSYSPRDPVTVKVETTDLAGKPVRANVGFAVVDDTVLSYADDKSAQILAHLYLEPELGALGDGTPIEEPNFYFGDKPEAAAAMDALLGTRGWRKFEWQVVFNPPPPPVPQEVYYDAVNMDERAGAVRGPMPPAPPQAAPPQARLEVAKHEDVTKNKAGEQKKLAVAATVAAPAKKPANLTPPATPVAPKPVMAQQPMHVAAADKPVAGKQMAQGHGAPAGVAMGGVAANRDFRRARGRGLDEGELANAQQALSPVRVFPVPAYTKGYDGPRTDFRETIYWNPNVDTGASGIAEVKFVVSDAVTSFRATAEGVSAGGLPGRGDAVLKSKMPLTLDAKLPIEVSSGDQISLPITLTNETDHDMDADLVTNFGTAFAMGDSPVNGKIHLRSGEKKSYFFPLKVVSTDGDADVDIALDTVGLKDEIKKTIRVVPLGFPFELSASGTAKGGAPGAKHEFELANALPGSIHATVTMFPSPLAAMTKGMQGMIRQPGGCFEQTSSTNYPNVMIMSYLGANDAGDPALVQQTQAVLEHGYKLLTGYETKEKGYEWFGHTPGHEALTAYGLMEFADMSHVYDVDHAMIERTADWLMSRRDGKGGFLRNSEALDSFGRASADTTNAYIMWALSEAKRVKGLEPELAAQKKFASDSKDPYIVALAANVALNVEPKAGETDAQVKRLLTMQKPDGSFGGAKESITMSGGQALDVEATGLAVLALIKASPNSEYENELRAGVDYLNAKRGGFGEWGNTQATVLALKALTAYSEHSRQMQADGTATLIVNGQEAGALHFEKGRKDALVWDDVAASLKPGHNTIEVRIASQASLPYSISIEYRSARPQSSEKTKISVATTIDKTSAKMGEGVKMHAHVENVTANGIPMTLARVGIPGGLAFQTWQLKELKDKGAIDFYETRPREVILYWRAMAPSAKKDVELDLLASVPGTYVAPASSGYLYYTAEDKAWTAPVTINVER